MTTLPSNSSLPDQPLVPAPGKRMSAENRRRQIARVAMRLFAQKGFTGTTTKEIAGQAGISEAIIFRHFATKQELYAAILDEKSIENEQDAFWLIMRDLASRKDDQAFFQTLAQRILDRHRQDNTFMRLMLFSGLEGHELSEMFFSTHVQEVYSFLCGYIQQRIEEGAFQAVDPLLAARAFMGMAIHQSLTEQLFERNTADRPESHHLAEGFTKLFLNGIATPATQVRNRKKIQVETKG